MKNLLKFFLFVALLSIAISALYDYRVRHGSLAPTPSQRSPEKYTLPSEPVINAKQIASLESLNRERRDLVNSVIPAVVSVKTSKKVSLRRQTQLDPFESFFPNSRRFGGGPRDEAMVQNSLGSGVVVTKEGHIITNNHVVDQVVEVMLSDGRIKKARLVGADAEADLAVLKIDDPGVKPLTLADSDSSQVGDF